MSNELFPHENHEPKQNSTQPETAPLESAEEAADRGDVSMADDSPAVAESRPNRGRRIMMILAMCLIMVAVTGVGAFLGYIDPRLDSTPGPPAGRVTAVVMGVDERTQDLGRADTLMVVSFDPGSGDASVLSIPRDTRVAIPGYRGYNKVNVAYALGGPELVKRTVEGLLGIELDYYVKVDFAGFEAIVDALGGVEIDVEKRMKYKDNWGKVDIDLQPGLQRLDGKRALDYVRYRNDGLGDVSFDPGSGSYDGRLERQLKFVRALVKQVLTPRTLLRMPRLVRGLYDTIDTNIPLTQMLELGMAARRVSLDRLETGLVPGTGATVRGVSYWVVDQRKLAAMVGPMLLGDDQVATASGTKSTDGKAAAPRT